MISGVNVSVIADRFSPRREERASRGLGPREGWGTHAAHLNPDRYEVTLYQHEPNRWHPKAAEPITFTCIGTPRGKHSWILELVMPDRYVEFYTGRERNALMKAIRERLQPLVFPRLLGKYTADCVITG